MSLNVPNFTARYADDLASLSCYACTHAIHRWLMGNVPLIATRVQLHYKGKYTTIGYLKGYAIDLIIWFYEMTCSVNKLHVGWTPYIMCYGEPDD